MVSLDSSVDPANAVLTDILTTLRQGLSAEALQEVADKMEAIQDFVSHSDGAGLRGGIFSEDVLHEILAERLGEAYARHNHKDADMRLCSHPVSFKKISGKASLAIRWSKNPPPPSPGSPHAQAPPAPRFECPVLIMNLTSGRWWRRKQGFDAYVASGFYLVDPDYCNKHVRLGKNNKTDTLIDCQEVYGMLRHSLREGRFLALPPPRTRYYEYSAGRGFRARETPPLAAPAVPTNARFTFVDLFCGVGGFHQALGKLGGACVFACDIDADCRSNYADNYGLEPASDIRSVDAASVPPHDVLCAGFPCQPFSKAGDQDGFQDQTKGTLFEEICRILAHHHPSFFLLENVRNLLSHDGGRTWAVISTRLKQIGYAMPEVPLVLSPHLLGTPQIRQRAFLVGRYGSEPLPEFPPPGPAAHTDIRSILVGDGARLDGRHARAGEIWEEFCALLRTHATPIPIPRFPLWTDHWDTVNTDDAFYRKYRGWIDKNREFYAKHRDLLEPWLIRSRRDPMWTGAVRKMEWQCDRTSLRECLWTFRGSGLRVRGLEYSPTLVAMAMVPVYGPEWRWLSPREMCRLQDFPDDYRPHAKDRVCFRQMGNAVNVRVVCEVARWLLAPRPPENSESDLDRRKIERDMVVSLPTARSS